MHTLRLEVKDTIFDKVMFFLNNLPKDEVKLSVEDTNYEKVQKLKSISLKTSNFHFDRNEANAR